MKKKYLLLFLVILGAFFLSFKLISIPPGLENDEGSIAYNSALISNNLRDQNNRFFPIFILSSDKIDWKQPVLIYFTAFLFKIFGKDIFVYKMANIIISLSAATCLYFISKILFKDQKYSIASFIIFITTPIIFITSRIGNESILPALISTIWLITLLLYQQNKKNLFLFFNAFIIGIGFYTFKGMRIIIPVWSIISLIYIYYVNWNKKNNFFKNIFIFNTLKKIIIFSVTLLPFLLITPLLELKYAGAVFDRQSISISSIYNFLYYWFSNISISFWFTIPDMGRIYAIREFGAILLAFFPFFIIGVIKSINNKTKFRFILSIFIFTPFLFGIAHSTNYTHRLTAMVPFIILLILYGIKETFKLLTNKTLKKIIQFTFTFLIIINVFSFYKFYFTEYPKLNTTKEAFGKNILPSFKMTASLAEKYGLKPLIEEKILNSEGDEPELYNLIYFKNQLQVWKLGENIPNGSILLTENEKIDGLETQNLYLPDNLFILIKK